MKRAAPSPSRLRSLTRSGGAVAGVFTRGSAAVVLLLPPDGRAGPVDGYEAMGYLTHTRFDASSSAASKSVMMFDVKVAKDRWHVRTEPVIECKGGIGFYEASAGTNDSVLTVTALEPAYKSAESPFQALRDELKKSRKDDVYFTNAPFQLPAAISNLLSPPASSGKRVTPRANNVAVAVAMKGKYPPVDPSYVAFLWFAFMPPDERDDGTNKMLLQVWDDGNPSSVAVAMKGKYPPVDPSYVAFLWFAFMPPDERDDGTNKMLLQVWDDGNPQKTRFRRAKWNQFAEPPHLVSSAVYSWMGKELLPSGGVDSINISDVGAPLEMAARYDVDVATNFSGFVLPLDFRLTRFSTKRLGNTERKVSSTVVASVVKVVRFAAGESLEIEVPGRTFVSDYRLSDGGLKGTPLKYFLGTGSPPAAEQLKGSRMYNGALRVIAASPARASRRWLLVAGLLIPSVVAILLWMKSVRTRESSGNSSSQQTQTNKT